MKILIVEDSRANLAVLRQYVEQFGATALCAESGETALQLYEQNRPDLILLDIVLPGMDGLAVARQVRAMEKGGDWTPSSSSPRSARTTTSKRASPLAARLPAQADQRDRPWRQDPRYATPGPDARLAGFADPQARRRQSGTDPYLVQ